MKKMLFIGILFISQSGLAQSPYPSFEPESIPHPEELHASSSSFPRLFKCRAGMDITVFGDPKKDSVGYAVHKSYDLHPDYEEPDTEHLIYGIKISTDGEQFNAKYPGDGKMQLNVNITSGKGKISISGIPPRKIQCTWWQ